MSVNMNPRMMRCGARVRAISARRAAAAAAPGSAPSCSNVRRADPASMAAASSSPSRRCASASSRRTSATSYGASTSSQAVRASPELGERVGRVSPGQQDRAAGTCAAIACMEVASNSPISKPSSSEAAAAVAMIPGRQGDLRLCGQQPDAQAMIPGDLGQRLLDPRRQQPSTLPSASRSSESPGCGMNPYSFARVYASSAPAMSPTRRRTSPIS